MQTVSHLLPHGPESLGRATLSESSGATRSRCPFMQRFAAGLRKDMDAVRAGLTQKWSNRPVERFVHKLKLLKR